MFNSTWLKQNMSPGQVLPRSPQSVTWARLPNPAPQPILSKMDSNALKRNLITIAVVTSFSLSHKCQRGSGEWGLLILPKLAWRIPPKESNLILPGWLSHLPPLLLCPNCQWILVQIVSLVCDLHFCHYTVRLVLPSVWLIMGPEISDSYPCGVDGTLSALILSSGMSIIIQEAPPFFPPGCVWYT